MNQNTSDQIVRDLKPKLAGRVLGDPIARHIYSTDASIFRIPPLAVVEPKDARDVETVVGYARENRIPLAPRGAGSGLAGEALTAGIVLDFSVFMNRSLSIDPDRARVRVEPGAVWGALNQQLKPFGKLFGPDPSTGNRCTLAGMIANNSAGAHSLQYGMTNRWVRGLKVMLDDGKVLDLKPMSVDAAQPQGAHGSREDRINRVLLGLLSENHDLIAKTWPAAPRNRHGYLLKHVLQNGVLDLTQLFCASEGTLGIILEAELEVSELPSHTGLVSFSFDSRIRAAEAVAPLLAFNPSAVEMIDRDCLDMARANRAYAALYGPAVDTVLLVEFQGQDPAAIEEAINAAEAALVGPGKPAIGSVRCPDERTRALVWEMRKHISGTINRVPGALQPAAVIEDACVHPAKLPEYLQGVERILKARGLKFLCFGHAGDGTVHIRPYLDRKDLKTLEWLPEVCSEVYDLTLSLGGTISAEHGDGLLRAPFIKKQYGALFDAFVKIKDLFDPDRIMNPGKKVDCRGFETWERFFRFKGAPAPGDSRLLWPEGRLAQQVEACNGCSACRSRLPDGAMCPIFRGLGTELASTRAKANIMWGYLAGELKDVAAAKLREAAELCVNCKMCAVECPAGVSAGDLMLELKARLAEDLGQPWETRVLLRMERLMRAGSYFPKLFNFIGAQKWIRALGRRVTGLAEERAAPRLALKPFSRRHPELQKNPAAGAAPKAALFVDTFIDLVNVDAAEALLNVLRHNGIEVVIPPQAGSGIVPLTYGDAETARRQARFNVEKLAPFARAGWRIVCAEPTAALMLKDEYLRLGEDADFTATAEAAVDAMSFLWELKLSGKLKSDFKHLGQTVGYHAPCHLKALNVGYPSLDLLRDVPGLKVVPHLSECCGIAGTYGMRTKGYQNSMAIGAGLFEFLRRPEIDYGLSECSTCRLQMEHGVPEKKTLHPAQILAAAYGY